MHGGPVGLVLDLGDPGGRGVDRPEAVEPKSEGGEHHDAHHDRVADQHDRLVGVRLLQLREARAHALRDLGDGLAAQRRAEVRGRAPLFPPLGKARADLVAGQSLPRAEGHLGEGRDDPNRQAVRLRDHLGGGPGALERARVDGGDTGGRQRPRDRRALAAPRVRQRDVPRAREAPLPDPRRLAMPYDEDP